MVTYVTLYRYTQQGINNIQGAPKRIAAARKKAKAAGGEIVGVYLTQGQYDLVAISRWPDEISATKFGIAQAQEGNVRTESMRAFDEGEIAQILS
jgi:uncharacterized protein with GYD domain